MARIRSINPVACDSHKLAVVSSDAERLFWRLLTHCDDSGRCEDDSRLIWARCVPLIDGWSPDRVHELLDELSTVGLIVRYRGSGKALIEVGKWSDHQHPQRPTKSKYEAPPVHLMDGSRTTPGGVASGGEWSGEGEQPETKLADSSGVDNLASVRALREQQKEGA